MRPTDKTLLEQMKIHEAEIFHRKKLIDFSKRDAELLKNCQGFILERLDGLVTEFYDHQISFDEVALIIGDADTLQRLIAAQKEYIMSLFDGTYDLEYTNKRLRIGLVHKRIGVEPKYYLSAVKVLKDKLSEIIRDETSEAELRDATVNALDKLLCFDIELVFDTYIRSLVTVVKSEKDKSEKYALSLEEKVAERTQALQELARRDGLTGLYNHRAFLEFLKRDIASAHRNNLPLSLLYFDVDKFKLINDQKGHVMGDKILQTIGKILSEISREVDVPCRYGGDEFCVILSGCTVEEAKNFCQRLQEQFSAQHEDITLSMGIAQTGPEIFHDHDELIKRADEAMYLAKKTGGFQVEISSP
ncbi:MAG: GGDEF domain-containing protein [Candidatus Electrothrix communis]|nr:GGDEF domain-containing protein [Desulfobulbus sp. US4]WLE98441.1 MAG: GGDEF domain-containing protein [Candidatus Electrothrix communis]